MKEVSKILEKIGLLRMDMFVPGLTVIELSNIITKLNIELISLAKELMIYNITVRNNEKGNLFTEVKNILEGHSSRLNNLILMGELSRQINSFTEFLIYLEKLNNQISNH